MLERRSALASAKPYKSSVLQIGEVRGFTLTQIAGLDAEFEKNLASVVGELPPKVGIVTESAGRSVMRIGPSQFWIIGPETDDLAAILYGKCTVTPLSNSRTRIFIARYHSLRGRKPLRALRHADIRAEPVGVA